MDGLEIIEITDGALRRNNEKGQIPEVQRVDNYNGNNSPDPVKSLFFIITPTPSFAVKVKITTDHIGHLFINICEHDAIPQSDRHVIIKHWPIVVVGNVRKTLDHEGRRCIAVDAIVHPSVVVDIIVDRTNSNRDQVIFTHYLLLFFF